MPPPSSQARPAASDDAPPRRRNPPHTQIVAEHRRQAAASSIVGSRRVWLIRCVVVGSAARHRAHPGRDHAADAASRARRLGAFSGVSARPMSSSTCSMRRLAWSCWASICWHGDSGGHPSSVGAAISARPLSRSMRGLGLRLQVGLRDLGNLLDLRALGLGKPRRRRACGRHAAATPAVPAPIMSGPPGGHVATSGTTTAAPASATTTVEITRKAHARFLPIVPIPSSTPCPAPLGAWHHRRRGPWQALPPCKEL